MPLHADMYQTLRRVLQDFLKALWTFIKDVFIEVFDLLISAFVSLISAIPVPGFISGGLDNTFSALDSGVLYLVSQAGVPQALAIIGAGYAFRLARKFATLFQW